MLFADISAVSAAVAATTKRSQKTAALAEVIARLEVAEIEAAIGFLSGDMRQGRIGTSWRSLAALDVEFADMASVTVEEVDAVLCAVQATTGPGSVAARAELLTALFSRMTPDESAMVRSLLSGGVRQGALAGVVSDAVAKAAGVRLALVRRAAMLTGDLGRAAVIALVDGSDGLAAVQLQVGVPVQPMLAGTSDSVEAAVTELGGDVVVEWKLDGARVQVHRQGSEVRVYTRNLNDVTDRLPGVVAVVAGFDVESVVLDGETLALDDDARPRAFQDTMSRFGRDSPGRHAANGDVAGTDAPVRDATGGAAVLRPWFFDVLALDGRSMIDEPLRVRRAVLADVAGDHCVPGELTSSLDVAVAVEAEALARGHEGVMVKGADAPYEAGRRGKAWRKVKPVHTLDLVVLAAEWGHGRRTGFLSNLHLGARDADTGDFVMVGKTFKGLTDAVLAWQTEQLLALETHRTGITVHVRPELVVEIAIDGVQNSTKYRGGAALRFARVRGYRNDKDPDGSDTIEAVLAMRPTGG